MPVWLAPITGAIATATVSTGLAVRNIFNTGRGWVRTGMSSVGPYGQVVWDGVTSGLERTKEQYDQFLEVLESMPWWFRVPFILLGRLLTYVGLFFKSTVFLWVEMYTSVMFWFWCGLVMLPLLYFEENPDNTLEWVDIVFRIFLSFWNFLAGCWNLCFDLCKPLLPIWNILWATLAEMAMLLLEIIPEIMGTQPATQEAWEERRRMFELDMGWYDDLLMPIVMVAVRFYWMFAELQLILTRLWLKQLAKVLSKIIMSLANLTKIYSCCGSTPICCFRQIGQDILNFFLLRPLNFNLSVLAAICIVGVCPLGWLCCIPPIDFLGCTAGGLVEDGVDCSCQFFYPNLKECPECYFECVENEVDMNWMKLCPGDEENPETIFEAGWCSHSPPEGKGPKPRNLFGGRSAAEFVGNLNFQMSKSVQNECYLTCSEGLLRRRCLSKDYLFEEVGKCGPILSRKREQYHHHNADFNREWARIEREIREAGSDTLECSEWMRKYNDTQVLKRDLKQVFREEVCIASYGFDTSSAQKKLEPKNYLANHINWFPNRQEGTNTQLNQHMMNLLHLSSSIHHHVTMAHYMHVNSFNPEIHDSQVQHYSSHLDFKGISEAWANFMAVNDQLMAHTGLQKHLDRLQETSRQRKKARRLGLGCCSHGECLNGERCLGNNAKKNCNGVCTKATDDILQMKEKPRSNSVFDPEHLRCAEGEIKCPDSKTCSKVITNHPDPYFSQTKNSQLIGGGLERRKEEILVNFDDYHECPTETKTTLSEDLWLGIQIMLVSLVRFDLITIFNLFLTCWKGRPKSQNPYDMQHLGNIKADQGDFTYCFPQINPYTDLSLPTTDWRLLTVVDEFCIDIKRAKEETFLHSFGYNSQNLPKNQGCLCTEYYQTEISEYNGKWFWFVPLYIKARLGNALLVTQFVFSHYLTQGTFVDSFWSGFWTLFFPNRLSNTFVHWFGKRTELPEEMEWMCVVLHLGSLVYIVFWFYFSFLLYRAFYAPVQTIIQDLFSVFMWFWNLVISTCESTMIPNQLPNSEGRSDQDQIPGLFPHHLQENVAAMDMGVGVQFQPLRRGGRQENVAAMGIGVQPLRRGSREGHLLHSKGKEESVPIGCRRIKEV